MTTMREWSKTTLRKTKNKKQINNKWQIKQSKYENANSDKDLKKSMHITMAACVWCNAARRKATARDSAKVKEAENIFNANEINNDTSNIR